MRLGYFVHDLGDAAVARRVTMLQRGGAEVALAGFHRTATPPTDIAGVTPIPLGQTADGKLAARAVRVVASRLSHTRIAERLGAVDALMARNLELLAVAAAVRPHLGPVPLTYELLDIHRMLLGRKGQVLRTVEGVLSASVSQLIVSSPAFVEAYVAPLSRLGCPVTLVENKLLAAPAAVAPRPAGPPWRVGLFGALRDRRSVEILASTAEAHHGAVEIDIRGKPSPAVFADLAATVAPLPHVTFGGAYRMPDDLAGLYGNVHFIWCVDYFEAGANSEWLLPNRLYEGGAHGAVPIARAGTATAARLAQLGIGHILHGEPVAALTAFFADLTPQRYAAMAEAVARVDASAFVSDAAECAALVDLVSGRSRPATHQHAEAA